MTPYNAVHGYHHFGGTCCFHLQCKRLLFCAKDCGSGFLWNIGTYLSIKLHGVTLQKTVILDTHSHKNLKPNITLHFIKVFLYLQFSGLDIANIALPLQSIGMELCTHKSGNSVMLMRTFVEGIQDIIDVSPSLQLSEHSLVGKFIKYLLWS